MHTPNIARLGLEAKLTKFQLFRCISVPVVCLFLVSCGTAKRGVGSKANSSSATAKKTGTNSQGSLTVEEVQSGSESAESATSGVNAGAVVVIFPAGPPRTVTYYAGYANQLGAFSGGTVRTEPSVFTTGPNPQISDWSAIALLADARPGTRPIYICSRPALPQGTTATFLAIEECGAPVGFLYVTQVDGTVPVVRLLGVRQQISYRDGLFPLVPALGYSPLHEVHLGSAF